MKKFIFLILFTLFLTRIGFCAITVDQSTSGASAGYSLTRTIAFTVNTQSNQILVIGIGLGTAATTTPDITGVTWNGTAMSEAVDSGVQIGNGYYKKGKIFYILNPDTGTHNVVATVNEGWADVVYAFVTIYNASQEAPEVTGSGKNGGSTTSSASATSTTNNDMFISFNDNHYTATMTVDSPLTSITEYESGSSGNQQNCGLGQYIKASAGAQTLSWTLSTSVSWVNCLAAFKPATTAYTGWVGVQWQ